MVVVISYSISFIWLIASSIILRNTVFSSELHDVAWYIATVFVMLTLPLSAYEICQHLLHYHHPDIQKYIVRILWMVPIYSVESLLALIWRENKIYIETMRECYEAYVIFCLLQLMINTVAQTDERLQEIVDTKDPDELHHMSMAKYCMKTWDHLDFFSNVRKGTLQYVIVKLLCTAIELITVKIKVPSTNNNATALATSPSSSSSSVDRCYGNEIEPLNYYCDGCFGRFDRAYIWCAMATNFSQIWDMYCLVLFYHAFMKELKPMNPLGKLLTVKAVVFFSFYQEVAVTGAVFMGWIKATQNPSSVNGCFSKDDVAKGFQDFLICIEMFVAAVVHHYVFSAKEYTEMSDSEDSARKPFMRAFIESSVPTDVIQAADEEFDLTSKFSFKRKSTDSGRSSGGMKADEEDDGGGLGKTSEDL